MSRTGSVRVPVPRCLPSGDVLHASLVISLILGVWSVQGLEVSVGKVPFVEAMNGSTVLLPCTYNSCIGIKNLYFSWAFQVNSTLGIRPLCHGTIAAEGMDPRVTMEAGEDRIKFVGSSKTNNISILLWNVTFDDEGEYVCFARNPKEKNRNHTAIFTLYVVAELKEVDNTLTTIIVSVVGGVIGLIIVVMVIKALVLNFLIKDPEKNKECLVSSGIDNTDNGGLTGAKADNKATPKA